MLIFSLSLLHMIPAAATAITGLSADVLKNTMMHLSFRDSLSFAKALSNHGNPILSKDLNPVVYHDPSLDHGFVFNNVMKADPKHRALIVEKLFQNERTKNQRIMFHKILKEAIILKDFSVIKVLVKHGIEPSLSVWYAFIESGQLQMLKEFVKLGVHPDPHVLRKAIYLNDKEAVAYLLSLDYVITDLYFALKEPSWAKEPLSNEIVKMVVKAKKEAWIKYRRHKRIPQSN